MDWKESGRAGGSKREKLQKVQKSRLLCTNQVVSSSIIFFTVFIALVLEPFCKCHCLLQKACCSWFSEGHKAGHLIHMFQAFTLAKCLWVKAPPKKKDNRNGLSLNMVLQLQHHPTWTIAKMRLIHLVNYQHLQTAAPRHSRGVRCWTVVWPQPLMKPSTSVPTSPIAESCFGHGHCHVISYLKAFLSPHLDIPKPMQIWYTPQWVSKTRCKRHALLALSERAPAVCFQLMKLTPFSAGQVFQGILGNTISHVAQKLGMHPGLHTSISNAHKGLPLHPDRSTAGFSPPPQGNFRFKNHWSLISGWASEHLHARLVHTHSLQMLALATNNSWNDREHHCTTMVSENNLTQTHHCVQVKQHDRALCSIFADCSDDLCKVMPLKLLRACMPHSHF